MLRILFQDKEAHGGKEPTEKSTAFRLRHGVMANPLRNFPAGGIQEFSDVMPGIRR